MSIRCARVPVVMVAGILTLGALAAAQQKDPFVGSWAMNPAKSKYTSSAPKSVKSTYEAAGKGYKVSVTIEPATGPVQQYSYTTNVDGKDAPITGNNPNADTVAVTRIDANTLELVSKKGGKVTTTQRNVMSSDGQTQKVPTTGTADQGQKVNNFAVFENQ